MKSSPVHSGTIIFKVLPAFRTIQISWPERVTSALKRTIFINSAPSLFPENTVKIFLFDKAYPVYFPHGNNPAVGLKKSIPIHMKTSVQPIEVLLREEDIPRVTAATVMALAAFKV
jgi:hypothetical protein